MAEDSPGLIGLRLLTTIKCSSRHVAVYRGARASRESDILQRCILNSMSARPIRSQPRCKAASDAGPPPYLGRRSPHSELAKGPRCPMVGPRSRFNIFVGVLLIGSAKPILGKGCERPTSRKVAIGVRKIQIQPLVGSERRGSFTSFRSFCCAREVRKASRAGTFSVAHHIITRPQPPLNRPPPPHGHGSIEHLPNTSQHSRTQAPVGVPSGHRRVVHSPQPGAGGSRISCGTIAPGAGGEP
jgi:hypothetical protein